jgi:aspartate-semialdehyde dehydrogenase
MREAFPKIDVSIAAPTGAVGQRFVELLHDHPYFNISALAASDRSAGKTYGEAVNWRLDSELPPNVAAMELGYLSELNDASLPDVVFSALPSDVASEAEVQLAVSDKAVFSNAAAHRMDKDVPLVIAEVNPDHMRLVVQQDSPGFIVANANCSSIKATLMLAPLHEQFGIDEAHIFTQQALSGAGYPGVSALDITDNVIPFIAGEADKLRREPLKMLGTAHQPADFPIFPTVSRVNVRDGHLIVAHLSLRETVGLELEHIVGALAAFRGPEDASKLPSAPECPIHVLSQPDRPQPRLDRDTENGMSVSVGQISEEPKTDRMGRRIFKLIGVGHNTIRGAAGQSVLNAELAYARGLLIRHS